MDVNIKHEYLRSRAYICLSLSSPFPSSQSCSNYSFFVNFIGILSIYRDTRTYMYILDLCIQEFFTENNYQNLAPQHLFNDYSESLVCHRSQSSRIVFCDF